jgi:hypothetical protein
LTPEQLAKVDRPLNAAEQKAVDEWQASQAAASQRTEEEKGGPKGSIIVKSKGATLTKEPTTALVKRVPTEESGMVLGHPLWQVILAGIGVLVAAGGLFYAVGSD